MASSKAYLNFILEQLSLSADITHKAMMGEYILYCRGKVIGGIYDDRLLLKPVPAACALLPDAALVQPYEGAKPMLHVTRTDDKAFLAELLQAMHEELPAPKSKRK